MQTENQVKADAINEFVCNLIGDKHNSQQITVIDLKAAVVQYRHDKFDEPLLANDEDK